MTITRKQRISHRLCARIFTGAVALSFISAIAADAVASPFAANGGFDNFDNSVPLAESELAELRGGFIDVSGAKIDFELVNRTIIDGVVQNEFALSSENISQISDISQNIVQIGDSNDIGRLNELVDLSNVLTVVQNSKDGTLIQNLNELDITLQNFGELQSNSALSNALNLSPLDGLR